MGQLTPDQRQLLYSREATRAGIHKGMLAALYRVQAKPSLLDGELGLGMAPANQIALEEVDTFPAQVQYAANTIRSLTNSLIVEGWKSIELWDAEQGRYTDAFVQAIAAGYTAPPSEPTAALLKPSDPTALLEAYLRDLATDAQVAQLPQAFAGLDAALLAFLARLPRCYFSLPYQREALLEAVRLWSRVDTRDAAIAALRVEPSDSANVDDAIDAALRRFVPRIAPHYAGYPHQREALLRLVQLWQQLDSRAAAIVALAQNITPALGFSTIDAALLAIVQRLPQIYEGKGDQRNALVETFRLWHQQDSRSAALIDLGVNPDIFTNASPNQTDIIKAATQLDHALLDFIYRLPTLYEGTRVQRDALLLLTQLWRSLSTPEQALQSLLNDLKQMAIAHRDTLDAPPTPLPLLVPPRPDRWTPDTLQLYATIIPDGSFTWAEATSGGLQRPPNQATVDAIIRLAQRIQQARDRLSRPFHVISWYSTVAVKPIPAVSPHRYLLGDALTFYCNGLTGAQLYWFLDSWWVGGLGHNTSFPYLCYVDARSDRARWSQ